MAHDVAGPGQANMQFVTLFAAGRRQWVAEVGLIGLQVLAGIGRSLAAETFDRVTEPVMAIVGDLPVGQFLSHPVTSSRS